MKVRSFGSNRDFRSICFGFCRVSFEKSSEIKVSDVYDSDKVCIILFDLVVFLAIS